MRDIDLGFYDIRIKWVCIGWKIGVKNGKNLGSIGQDQMIKTREDICGEIANWNELNRGSQIFNYNI